MELQHISYGLSEASEKISKYLVIQPEKISKYLVIQPEKISKYLVIQPEIPLWMTLTGIGLTALAAYWIYKEFRKPDGDEGTYKKPIF